MTADRQSLIEEKRAIESALAAIRKRKQDRELEILRGRHTPHDEFSLLKQAGIEARQQGDSLRERLVEIGSELSAAKAESEHSKPLESIVLLLTEIRDALQKSETWR